MPATTAIIRLRPLRPGETGALPAVAVAAPSHGDRQRAHAARPRPAVDVRPVSAAADDRRRVALVAEAVDAGGVRPVGIGRLTAADGGVAEVAFGVVDDWRGRGVGRRLLTALRHRAVDLGFERLSAHVMVGNVAAAEVVRSVLPGAAERRVGVVVRFTAPLPSRPSSPPVTLAV